MSLRSDRVQLDIEINGKKAKSSVKDLRGTMRTLTRELNQLTPGTDKFIKKSQQLQKVKKRYGEVRDQIRGIDRSLLGTIKHSFRFQNVVRGIATVLPSLGIASLLSNMNRVVRNSIRLFNVQQKAEAQVKQGLKSTQNAVGRTFEQLKKQASDLQSETIFGDEEILKGATAQLLTFTNITGTQFDRTQKAALDLATRLDGDLKSASIQLGKALNDPVANLSALSRSGIQFSDDQTTVIKSLVETNQLAEAQTIILDELERQYGGSAAAAAKAGTGGFEQLQNQLGDIQETIGGVITSFASNFLPLLSRFANAIGRLTSDTTNGVQEQVQAFKDQQQSAAILFSTLENLTDELANAEEGTREYNSIAEAKRQVVDDINRQYGTYLPNLLTEKSSLDDIRIAQQAVNNELVKKQVILAFQDKIQKAIEKELEAREKLALIQRARASGSSGRVADELVQLGVNERAAQRQADILNQISEGAEQFNNEVVDTAKDSQKEITAVYQSIFDDLGVSMDEVMAQINGRVSQSNIPTPAPAPGSGSGSSSAGPTAAQLRQNQLKELELTYKREQLLLEKKLIDFDVTEEQFRQQAIEKERQYYQDQIDILEEGGDEELDAVKKVKNKILAFENKVDQERKDRLQDPNTYLNPLLDREDEAQRELRRKFAQQVIDEQNYQQQLLTQQMNYYEMKLAALRLAGLQETQAYKDIEDAKLNAVIQSNKKQLESQQRKAQVEQTIDQARMKAAQNFTDLGIELLDRDEEARRDNAGAIKAFESAKVLVNLYSEISGYYKLLSGLPGGPIIAGVLSGIATARSLNNIAKIKAAEFAGGGAIPYLDSRQGRIRTAPNISPTSKGDNILATVKSGETILNDDQVAQLGGAPTMKSIGVPGYNTGGRVTTSRADTTPTQTARVIGINQQTADTQALNRKLDQLIAVTAAEKSRPAYILYSQFEKAQNEVDNIRNTAGL